MSSLRAYELKTEDDYLDWVFGWYPLKYKEVKTPEDLEGVDPRHIEWRRVYRGEKVTSEIWRLKEKLEGAWYVPYRIPDVEKYEGLRSGDVCATIVRNPQESAILKLRQRAEKIGATLYELNNFPVDIPGHFPDPEYYKRNADICRLWICCVQMHRLGGRGFDEGR
ncbi:hypothetical protein HY621_03690 [Candidatus Uhrbacteria bacterium]|nr:hypothetical protein [Candidatus Uhrbacteria bacterium]